MFRPISLKGHPVSIGTVDEPRRLPGAERRLLLGTSDFLGIATSLCGISLLWPADSNAGPHTLWLSLTILLGIWTVSAAIFECYDLRIAAHARASILAASSALVATALAYLAATLAIRDLVGPLDPRPAVLAASLVMALPMIAIGRLGYAKLLGQTGARRRVAIVGTPAAARAADGLLRMFESEYVVVGLIASDGAGLQPSEGLAPLGPHVELARIVREHAIDEVIVADDAGVGPAAMDALIGPYEAGIEVRHISDVFEEISGRIPVRHLRPYWFAVLPRRPGGGRLYDAARRVADIACAGAALIVLAPALVVIAIAIRVDSPGPIIFRQDRAGYLGRCFTILKFRTMRDDAEQDGPRWAARGDPRRTRVGKMLRPTRLDELPQLWNVLVGDMSLIGPRPERPCFVDELGQTLPFYRVRSLVRPGITGWAQVRFDYAGSAEDSLEKLEYDLYYVKHRSPLLDLIIAFKTIGVLARASGR